MIGHNSKYNLIVNNRGKLAMTGGVHFNERILINRLQSIQNVNIQPHRYFIG